MQNRGESSAQPQQQPWAPSHEQQTGQFPQPRWGDQGAQYAQPQQAYAPPAPAPTLKTRPKWKTPLIAAVALVVGIAIGAAAGGGSKSSNAPDASGTTSTSSSSAPTTAAKSAPTHAAPVAPAAPATSVVLQTSGDGAKTTKTFIVTADWSVKYTYDCANFGTQGNFAVMEHGGDLDGLPIVNTLGSKGGDTTYQHGDAGQRSLEVNSECAWTLTVTSGDAG